MRVRLAVTEGPHTGRAFTFDRHDTFLVGRSKDAHFQLAHKDPYFSRFHFLVEVNPPACRLVDMASTNGTLVNGQRVTTIDLHDGDEIRGGQTAIRVAVEAGPGGAAPPARASELAATDAGPTVSIPGLGGAPMIPRYRIERELGRGGMGIVYLARSRDDGTPAAVKTVTPAVAESPDALARFLREATILRQLDHPNIVGFRDVGQTEGWLYFVMEYVDGHDAGKVVETEGPLTIGRAVDLGCQALDALAYAHGRGFVHRDIKPQNLLLASAPGGDVLKLADFGLARLYQDSPLSGLTLTGQIAGTPAFMAPEQITSFREVQPASDVYALGASLYYILTGRKPFDFPTGLQHQLLMVLQDRPVPLRDRRPEVPEGLAAVVDRALERDLDVRYPDAGAMRQELEAWRACG